jgi:ATP-dependent Lhr-like helicase
LLARIHRLTVATLRKEIEPVTPAQFMRWLLRWQHVAPGTQVRGELGTIEAVKQLQGFELAANAWERDILACRVSDYDYADLDQLCLSGAIGWGRLSPHPATLDTCTGQDCLSTQPIRRIIPTSVAPITFFVRDDCDWMQPHDICDEERSLSDSARCVLKLLRDRGALFFADLVKALEPITKNEVSSALWELTAAGLVTADAFENLRALIGNRRPQTGPVRVKRRTTAGRWSLLHSPPAEHSRAVNATCRMLLARYGIVFRELVTREPINLPWRELAQCFRRMEDRGEVRGGRFLHGFIGEQFALPIAVDSLRAIRRVESSGETITVSAADPLNLVGIIVPGERVPAISGRTVTFRDGVFVPADSAAQALAGD